jgi:hypothetical protein
MGWDALPFWYSEYMPTTKSEFVDMVSPELLEMMANPIYNQPQSPLSGVYTKKKLIRGTKGNSSGACRNNFKFRVDGDPEKSCKWVKQEPSTRCNENGARTACKQACDNCPCSWWCHSFIAWPVCDWLHSQIVLSSIHIVIRAK